MYSLNNNPVRDLMLTFEKNKIGKKIMYFFIDIGFEDFVYRTINKKYLKTRVKFYDDKKEKIDENVKLLADETSKNVYLSMIKYRCTRKRKDFPEYSIEDQYFPKDIIKIQNNEVFIDCGAFNGDTLRSFKKYSGDKFKTAICFEPDKKNYDKLVQSLNEDKRIKFYNNAVDECCKKVPFIEGEGMGSIVSEKGNTEVNAVNLDSIDDCKDASFIKMNIEGLEPEALKGAINIIKNNKPKLAICIYHSENDMINIINYIHQLVPEYKLYVRQHQIYETETVLYCI